MNKNKMNKSTIIFLVFLGLPLLITSCDSGGSSSGSSYSSSSSSSSSSDNSCKERAKSSLELCLEMYMEKDWGICEKDYYNSIKYC